MGRKRFSTLSPRYRRSPRGMAVPQSGHRYRLLLGPVNLLPREAVRRRAPLC
jgi:hypothetical protein